MKTNIFKSIYYIFPKYENSTYLLPKAWIVKKVQRWKKYS